MRSWTPCFLLIAVALHGALAQPPPAQAFGWSNTNTILSEVEECSEVNLIVEALPNSKFVGVPPYYLIAFEASGTTTTSLIGTDPSHLAWRVNHRAGASLILTVTDSEGKNGGTSPSTVAVVPSSGTSASECPPPPTPSNITIMQTVTGKLQTCQPASIQISGGQKPYNVSLAATGSPIITNITMGPEDDVFTYINRAPPGVQMLAAVSDATGQWATSTSMWHTAGSQDDTCTGLFTSSGTKLPPVTSTGLSSTQKAIIAVSVTVGVILVITAFLFWRRRRERQRLEMLNILPRFWTPQSPASSTLDNLKDSSSIHAAPQDTETPVRVPSPLPLAKRQDSGSTVVSSIAFANPQQLAPESSVQLPPVPRITPKARDGLPRSLSVPTHHSPLARRQFPAAEGTHGARAITPAFPTRSVSVASTVATARSSPALTPAPRRPARQPSAKAQEAEEQRIRPGIDRERPATLQLGSSAFNPDGGDGAIVASPGLTATFGLTNGGDGTRRSSELPPPYYPTRDSVRS